MSEKVPPDMQALLDAGFTTDELRQIASDMFFAVIAAEESGQDYELVWSESIDWTPEKRAAWSESAALFLRQERKP